MSIDIEAIKDRMLYNAHDLGEFGKVIRLQYAFNILDELALHLVTDEQKDHTLSSAESDLGLLRDRIMTAIAESPYDFRTVESLSNQLRVPEDILRRELEKMEHDNLIRRPIVPDTKYNNWYRDVRRGSTRQEKWHRMVAITFFKRRLRPSPAKLV